MNHCYISCFTGFFCLFVFLSFGLGVRVRAVCALLYHVVSRSWDVYPLSCLTGPSLALVAFFPAGLELSVQQVVLKLYWLCLLAAQLPKIWDYRHVLPTPVCHIVSSLSSSSSSCLMGGGVGQGTTSGVFVPPCWRQGSFVVLLPVQVAGLWVWEFSSLCFPYWDRSVVIVVCFSFDIFPTHWLTRKP